MTSIATVLEILLYAFLVCLLIRSVFSWIEPYPRNRVHRITFDLTEPFLRPVRRFVPPLGGFDISFIIVWVIVLLLLGVVQRAS
jgi:YggT family protein